MARTAAHKRSTFLAAALAAVLAMVLALGPGRAHAASAGGTRAAGGASTPAPASSRAQPTSTAHVRSVRITALACTPTTRCSGNPRQVSTHGTLLVTGAGIKAGMVLAFPKAPGARVSRTSPAARLRKARAGLLVDGARQGPLGSRDDPAEPRALHELVRPDLRLPSRAAPAGREGHRAGHRRGHPHGNRPGRPGDVDLVRQPLERRQRPRDTRAGARIGRHHGVREELGRLEQLLEPVLAAARGRTARGRREGVRVAVRVRDATQPARPPSAPRRSPTAPTAW